MKRNTTSLFKTWVDHAHEQLNPAKDNGVSFDLLQNQQFIDLMERAPCVVFIMNHATSRYEFFSKNVKSMMGYTSDEMIAGGIPFGVKLIDESQTETMAKHIIPTLFEHYRIFSIKKEMKKIMVSYSFKYKKKNGDVRWNVHQTTILETNDEGAPLLSLVFMTDIHDVKKDEEMDFSVLKQDDEGIYKPIYNISFPSSNETNLTPREWEIVSMINSGNTSRQIADLMCISNHTVKTHRKNILEKFGATNTPNLLNIFRRKGLLA